MADDEIEIKLDFGTPPTSILLGKEKERVFPYFEYPTGGDMLTFEELSRIVQEEIYDEIAKPEYKDDINAIIGPEENSAINYIEELMVNAASEINRKEYFKMLEETGELQDLDFSKMGGIVGTFDMGKFFEKGMLGLNTLDDAAYNETTQEPDIGKKRIEIKTDGNVPGHVPRLEIEVGGTSAYGTYPRGRENIPVTEYLSGILNSTQAEKRVILFKLYKKMQNFLYIRFEKNATRVAGAKGKTYEKGTWKFLAMILFMKLLLKHLVDEVDKAFEKKSVLKINVTDGGWKGQPGFQQWIKNYSASIDIPTMGYEGAKAFDFQLNKIKEFYGIRKDLINEVTEGTTILAREFFKEINRKASFLEDWIYMDRGKK